MQSDYRVKEIFTDEETGDVIARCYDVLYGEEFEKFIGQGDDFFGKENASSLLQDSNYEMSDEIRQDLIDIFNIVEFEDDQDYDSYQFYDFGDDDFEDEEDELEYATVGVKESFNLREALNKIDLDTYNKYDLLNLYEACDLKENEKRALANIVYDQNDPSVIYDTLNDRFVTGKEVEMPERVKDGVIHEDTNGYLYYPRTPLGNDRYSCGPEFSSIKDAFVCALGNGYEEVVKEENTFSTEPYTEVYSTEELKQKFPIDIVHFKKHLYDDELKDIIAQYPDYTMASGEIDDFAYKFTNESKSIHEDVGAKTFSQWFDETNKGKYDKEWEPKYYPFTNYIKTFPNAEVLKDATAEDIKNNAHKFYDIYDVDSVDREAAFTFASDELGIDYDDFYYAWIKDQPMKGVNNNKQVEETNSDMVVVTMAPQWERAFTKFLTDNGVNAVVSMQGDKVEYTIKLEDEMRIRGLWNPADYRRYVNESVDEFEFDDEFNAYYDGYTEEDKDENSAFNKLKNNVDESLYDSKYITDEIASKTNSQEIKDAIDKNNLSVLVRDNTWYTEKCPNGLGKALKDEMKRLYPDLKHMYGESKSVKESVDEEPYTKEQIEQDLKTITNNFTEKEGELKCGFEEEKNFGVEILKQHYKIVEASGDGDWYHISYAEPVE